MSTTIRPAGTAAEREALAAEHEARALELEQEARDSFERCDTDGALSQWASDVNARKEMLAADLARAGGVWEFPALFDLEGNVASTHVVYGRWGMGWRLNDEAAKRYGKRFFNPSEHSDPVRRHEADRKRGFTTGRIRARGYVTLVGETIGSVWPIIRPKIADLQAGNFEIITTDVGPKN